jgi:hypothetical protein
MITNSLKDFVADFIKPMIPVGEESDPYADHVITLMTAGTWYEFTGDTLSTLSPDPTISLDSPVTAGEWDALRGAGFGGIFGFSGGVFFDNKLYITGGGHTDYHGNEWYAFDVPTMSWERINWPDISASYGGAADGYQDDTSRPSSYHTYCGLSYSTTSSKLFRGGGAPSGNPSPAYTGQHWTYDVDTDEYTKLTYPTYGGYDPGGIVPGTALCTCWDATNDRFWFITRGGLWSRDAASPTTATIRDAFWFAGIQARDDLINLVHDRANDLLVGLGWSTTSYIWDLTLPDVPVYSASHSWTGDGAAIVDSRNLGLEYDIANDEIIAWNGGEDIYVIDAVGLTATIESPVGANTVTPTATHATGANGRFRYIGQWGGKSCFIAVNSVSGSVYFYKRVA